MATPMPEVGGDLVAELEQELAVQADALALKVAETQERLGFLRELMATAESQLEADESLLRQLEGLLGRDPQLRLETLNPRLRGARLREVAVDILRRRAGHEPVHYRTWYAWVRGEGHLISGKDPVASFLTAVNKLDGLERVGGVRSGRYRLKTSAD